MKVVRSKSETRLIDQQDFFNGLCRDTRTDAELKLENSTLASSRRVMGLMLEQKADMKRHLVDFRRMRKEIEAQMKWMEEDVAAVEREKSKANIIHKSRFIRHAMRKGIHLTPAK